MVVESLVFGRYECIDNVWGDTVEGNMNTVVFIHVPRANHFPVGGKDLGGVFINRVLQLLNRRHVTYPTLPDCSGCNWYCNDSYNKQKP